MISVSKFRKAVRYLMPSLLLFFSMVGFIIFIANDFFNIISVSDDIHRINKHLFESSLSTIILVSIFCNINEFNKNCIVVSWIYWIANTPYIFNLLQLDIYFVIINTLVFGTFVWLCVKYVFTNPKINAKKASGL